MEKFIDRLIREFESGALGRREFCQMLGIATAIYAAGGPEANAAPAGRGLKGLGVNHVSYLCPDYRKARDFYSSMFGMRVTNDKGMGRANLAFAFRPWRQASRGHHNNARKTRATPAWPATAKGRSGIASSCRVGRLPAAGLRSGRRGSHR